MSSTFSGVRPWWICFIDSPAFSIAARVSRLMFADSMELICCSSVPICACVCSRECSCVFLRLRAAFAAIQHCQLSAARFSLRPRHLGLRTILVRVDVFARRGLLLVDLALEVLLALL